MSVHLPLEQAFLLLFVFILGLFFGSFATAIAHRVPAGLSWSFRRKGESVPRSACPSCGTVLGPLDLVPVFSWLALRGRCRHCRAPIGWAYPATELATGLACAGVLAGRGGGDPVTIGLILACPFLMALLLIDLRHFILPDSLNLILAGLWASVVAASAWQGADAIGLLAGGVTGGAVFGLLALALGWVMKKALGKDALGLGDVKFFIVAGLWLGAMMLPVFLIFSGFAGVVFGLVYRIVTKQAYFPFGPALIIAFYFCAVLADEIALPR